MAIIKPTKKKKIRARKMWGGRFEEDTNKLVENFTSSIEIDKRLYEQDIKLSIAHAKALTKVGLYNKTELKKVISALEGIAKDIKNNKIKLSSKLEDIHMNIEHILTQKVGELGRRIHTSRSRNDQVATDLRMYLRDETKNLISLLRDFQEVLLEIADQFHDVMMPGYTHLQTAQPILFSHYMMAYFEMLQRDKDRLADCIKRTNVMTLGSGALAGISLPLDRLAIAKELGFADISKNSLDAVGDRDFVIETLSACSILAMHISRLSEEFVIFSTKEFDLIRISDAFTTGSSMMPQKKNPDVAELARGKTGKIYGNLMAMLTLMKGLPLTYNRDMQEDKSIIFETLDSIKETITVFTEMLKSVNINRDKMVQEAGHGFSVATDLAEYLVRKGIPFRDAHETVGNIIKYCIETDSELYHLRMNEYSKFSNKINDDVYDVVTPERSIHARKVVGGTAPETVKLAIKKGKKLLEKEKKQKAK